MIDMKTLTVSLNWPQTNAQLAFTVMINHTRETKKLLQIGVLFIVSLEKEKKLTEINVWFYCGNIQTHESQP